MDKERIITRTQDVCGENVNWIALGERFKKFREAKNLSHFDVAENLNVADTVIARLEKGYHQDRKSINIIWNISTRLNLSINWLLNGIGKPHSPDPVELMPRTLLIQRGSGLRRSRERAQAEEGQYSDCVFEFVMAIDKFKSKNQVPFPTITQIYEIITALGYRKAAPARIAPLGYIIGHQKWKEKLNHWNEKIEISLNDREFRDIPKELPSPQPKRCRVRRRTAVPKARYDVRIKKHRDIVQKAIAEICAHLLAKQEKEEQLKPQYPQRRQAAIAKYEQKRRAVQKTITEINTDLDPIVDQQTWVSTPILERIKLDRISQ